MSPLRSTTRQGGFEALQLQLPDEYDGGFVASLVRVGSGSGRGVAFFFSSRRRHTRCSRDWSSDVCSSDLRSAKLRAPNPTVAASNEAFSYGSSSALADSKRTRAPDPLRAAAFARASSSIRAEDRKSVV